MAAAAAPLPAGWAEYSDQASGKVFYHNAATGTTTWDRPTDGAAAPAAQQPAAAQQSGGAGGAGGPDYSNFGVGAGDISQMTLTSMNQMTNGFDNQQGGASPGGSAPPGMKTGTVKAWFEEKGFGFITQQDGGDDVFVHRTNLNDGDALTQGNTVYYETTFNSQRGKLSINKLLGATRTENGKGSGKGAPVGGEAASGMPTTGKVKVWFEDKGFGFLTPDDASEDIFVHRTNLVDGSTLEQGSPVKYTPQWNDAKQKYIATQCSGAIGGSGGMMGGGGGYGKGGGKGWGQDRYQPYGQGGGQMGGGMQQMGGGGNFGGGCGGQQGGWNQGGGCGGQQDWNQGGGCGGQDWNQGGGCGGGCGGQQDWNQGGGCGGGQQDWNQGGGCGGGQQSWGQQGGGCGGGGFGGPQSGQDWNQGGCGGQGGFQQGGGGGGFGGGCGPQGGYGGQQDFGGMSQMGGAMS